MATAEGIPCGGEVAPDGSVVGVGVGVEGGIGVPMGVATGVATTCGVGGRGVVFTVQVPGFEAGLSSGTLVA